VADVRTMKLNLLADVSQFGKSLSKAEDNTKSFSGKMKGYSKVAAKAFGAVGIAAGVMAIKIGVDGVKAAIEDEVSQKKLAKTLQNVTKATDKQVEAAEEYITKQQLQYGIADTKLRPALGNLIRYTGDYTKAQELNNLAIDIAAGTGKDLETISTALGKAYGGNLGALKKLGIPLDENIIKTKDFEAATKDLSETFGGSAQANTETFEGKVKILNEQWGEFKENIGVKIIPILKDLMDNVKLVSQGFSGEDPDGLTTRARELGAQMNGSGAYSVGGALKAVTDAFGALFGEISGGGPEAASTLETLAGALESIANGIDAIARNYKKIKPFIDFVVKYGYNYSLVGMFLNDGPGGGKNAGKAAGGFVKGGQAYRVGEFGPETFIPSGAGTIRSASSSMGDGVTIIMNGVIDGESARRSIERLLQDSSRRTGAINLVGATL
jgi:hypothetical protein